MKTDWEYLRRSVVQASLSKFWKHKKRRPLSVWHHYYYHPWFREGFGGYGYSLASSVFLHAWSLKFPSLSVKDWRAELLHDWWISLPFGFTSFLQPLLPTQPGTKHQSPEPLPWLFPALHWRLPVDICTTWSPGIWSCRLFCFGVHSHSSAPIRQTAHSACSMSKQLTSNILVFTLFLTLMFYEHMLAWHY